MKSSTITDFRLINIINPVYLFGRIKSITSFDDLSKRIKNVFLLAFKIITLRYGERYWDKKRKERFLYYTANLETIDDPDTHCEIGEFCFHKKDYATALAAYKRAIETCPESEVAHFRTAEIYSLMQEYRSAIDQIKKTIEINPLNIYSHLILAKAYAAENMFPQALEEFKEVLELNKGDRCIEKQVCEERARIYSIQEDHNLLIGELKSLMALNPSDVSIPLSLNLSYKMIGKYSEAQKEFDRALGMLKDEKKLIKTIASNESQREKNRFTNELEIAQGTTKLMSKVRTITLCLTNRCNLNCKMCWSEKLPAPGMPKKVKEEIVKTFPHLEEIMWAGGEVFLDADFNDMLDEAIKHKVRQVVITNGLLMNEEHVHKFIKNGIRLIISIDGTTKEVYEDIRRGAEFEIVIEKLNLINRIKAGINPDFKIELNTVVMRANYHQIESFVEFARTHGFSKINFFMVVGNSNNQNIFAQDTDENILSGIARAVDRAVLQCGKYGIGCFHDIRRDIFKKNAPGPFADELCSTGREDTGQKEKLPNRTLKCFAPWKRVNIDFLGNVRPDVHCLCKNIVGNLNSQSMEDIWNGEKITEYRKKIVSGDIDKVCTLKEVYKEIPAELLG
ncbi:MAG: radical SAM protein [Elusimicrobia bacterium]|nr:radical SAM protein [Candidatus Liberimonas magnetica]